jgi:hypothetical protein
MQVITTKELAKRADAYAKAKAERLVADKIAAALKAEESKLKTFLMETMVEQGLTAIGGAIVRLELDSEPVQEPVVEDWPKLYKYIQKTGDFSLLEKRIGKAAVKEQWENGKKLPGVGSFPVWKLHEHIVK